MKDLEKALQNIQVTPDNNWYSSTYEKVINESSKNQNNLFINYLTMTKVRLAFLAVFGFTLLAVVGVVLGVGLLNRNSKGIQFVALTDEEKLALFQNIIANNPSGVLNSENKSASTAALNAANSYMTPESDSAVSSDQAMTSSYRIGIAPAPFQVSDKILVSEYKNEKGPVTCSYANYDNPRLNDIYSNTVSLSASYQDKDGTYYNKYENTYQGTLIGSNYSKGTTTMNESYEYRGGQFAVYSKYEYAAPAVEDAPVPMPTDLRSEGSETPTSDATTTEDVSVDEYINMYYGENATVLGKVSENGKEYFVIETKNFNYCNDTWVNTQTFETPNFWEGENYPEQPATTVDENNKIVSRQWIDVSTYEMYKTEDYLQSVTDANLITRMTFTNSEVEPTAENINEYFTFDLTTDIRDNSLYQSNVSTTPVEYNPSAEVDKTFNLFAQNDVALASSSDANLKFNYAYFTDPDAVANAELLIYIPEYYKERDFFPSGEIGDLLFEAENTISDSYKIMSSQPSGIVQKGSFSLSTVNLENQEDNKYASFSIYDSTLNDIDIVNTVIYSPTVSRSITDAVLNFGGEEVQAKVYNYVIKNQIYYSTDPTVSARDIAMPAPDVDTNCAETGCEINGHVVIFEKNGFKYVLTLNQGIEYTVPFTDELFNSYGFQFVLPGSAGFDSLKNDYLDYLTSLNNAAVTEPAKF